MPVVALIAVFRDFIGFESAALGALMNNLPPFFAVLDQVDSHHDPKAATFSVARDDVIDMQGCKAKGAVVPVGTFLQPLDLAFTGRTGETCIFFFFTHSVPSWFFLKKNFKKAGFRLILAGGSFRAFLKQGHIHRRSFRVSGYFQLQLHYETVNSL